MSDIYSAVSTLLFNAQDFLEPYDLMYAEYELFNYLNLEYKILPKAIGNDAKEILKNYHEEQKMNISFTEFYDRIMGILSPRPNQVISKFQSILQNNSQEALAYLYNLEKYNGYLKGQKKMIWNYSYIILSITDKGSNSLVKNDFDCPLCLNNMGNSKIFKTTLRIIPIKLANEKWFLQFPPYEYYNYHFICISEDHHPMKIDNLTFQRMYDFLKLFPQSFIGLNAPTPIVGGSVLEHEHFQGGVFEMPIFKAGKKLQLCDKDFPNLNIVLLDWPTYTILIQGDFNEVNQCGLQFYYNFLNYKDGIIDNDYNTMTAFSNIKDNQFNLYLTFRNYKTNAIRPKGLFHTQEKYHYIKKEGIGVIEIMGLIVLPSHLINDFYKIKNALYKNDDIDDGLEKYQELFENIKQNNTSLEEEVGKICLQMLSDIAVFNDERFLRYMKILNIICC